MLTLILLLWLVGGVMTTIGSIWFLIVAFKENIFWGLGCIFLPFVSLIFLCMNWYRAREPFMLQFTGFIIFYLGILLGGSLTG